MLKRIASGLPRSRGVILPGRPIARTAASLAYSTIRSGVSGLILSRVPESNSFRVATRPIPLLRSAAACPRRHVATELAKIRNVAIIAHVDHGKTTLVDQLLKQSGSSLSEERVMDSNVLEKERGITILAKNTSIYWQDYKLNIVDTPGHGDFGGEVERIISMVNGVVLVVDATEGVMTQTKFVLSKALAAGLKPVVVLNKMDRAGTIRVDEVESEIFDLFIALNATAEQMDFPTLYASGKAGWAIKGRTDARESLTPLFEAIVSAVPPPPGDRDGPFSMLVTTLEADNFVGRILTGRVMSGSVSVGARLQALDLDGSVVEEGRVTKLVARQGLERIVIDQAVAGDIVGIAGFAKASATATLCSPEVTTPIKSTPIDPPVMSMMFSINTSPLAGKEGTQHTFPALLKRLRKEVESNLSLAIKETVGEAVEVRGRGELQLGILIENLRREGFELSISPPQVVFKTGPNGEKFEPQEEVTVDCDEEHSALVMEKFQTRKAEMLDMKQVAGRQRLSYRATSRSLFGLRNELNAATSGTTVMNQIFHSYVPAEAKLDTYKRGALISMAEGETTAYALAMLEPRGVLFVGPQTKVYKGMIIGEHSRDNNLEVNPCKAKHLTNVRTKSAEEQIRLTPPRRMSLEEAMAYVRPDELLEVTPRNIRLRKAQL